MNKNLIVAACILGGTSVIFGAFGAHALKALISLESQQTFETGVRYQMYHALFLFLVGNSNLISKKVKNIVMYLVVIGVLFFSGSIYGLSTNELVGFDFKSIAFITPIGGLLMILAWSWVIIDLLKNKVKNGLK